MEAAHDVPPHVRQLEHLAQLLEVAGDEVQEAEAVKALGLLVAELDDLVVALAKGLQTWGHGKEEIDLCTENNQLHDAPPIM